MIFIEITIKCVFIDKDFKIECTESKINAHSIKGITLTTYQLAIAWREIHDKTKEEISLEVDDYCGELTR